MDKESTRPRSRGRGGRVLAARRPQNASAAAKNRNRFRRPLQIKKNATISGDLKASARLSGRGRRLRQSRIPNAAMAVLRRARETAVAAAQAAADAADLIEQSRGQRRNYLNQLRAIEPRNGNDHDILDSRRPRLPAAEYDPARYVPVSDEYLQPVDYVDSELSAYYSDPYDAPVQLSSAPYDDSYSHVSNRWRNSRNAEYLAQARALIQAQNEQWQTNRSSRRPKWQSRRQGGQRSTSASAMRSGPRGPQSRW